MENVENKPSEIVILNKRVSTYESINDKLSDQDTQQKINVFFAFMFELYRILMASFLIMFVPQNCGDNICGMTENLYNPEPLYQATSYMNGITLFSFIILYSIEVKRENKMINYLHVNKNNATDNDSVGEIMKQLPITKTSQIHALDSNYQTASYFAFSFFIINTILSSVVVFGNYLDNKTFTVFLTNVLFMILKLNETYANVNTKKNIFYSAYLKDKVQFNDIDPDKIIKEDDITIEENINGCSISSEETIKA